MFGSTKTIWRSLFLLAGAVLLFTQPSGLLLADRDQATCVQTCNAIRSLCQDVCTADCLALYPAGSTEFSVCNSSCRQGCGDDSQECKAKCNIKKNPPHNPEP